MRCLLRWAVGYLMLEYIHEFEYYIGTSSNIILELESVMCFALKIYEFLLEFLICLKILYQIKLCAQFNLDTGCPGF